ncbi:MAG: SLC13 family permease [Candidatus Latescibacterota bacterium]
MGLDAWLCVGVVLAVLAVLVSGRVAPDAALMGGLTTLLVGGVLSPQQALAAAATEGMATVGVLFVVVAGLTETGAVGLLGQRLLGRPRALRRAQARLMAPVLVLSSFLNNTPVVAVFLPIVDEWARKLRLPLSGLLIPLSYAAILGGTCTLIGTSTNLVVDSWLRARTGMPGLGLFEIAAVGVPCSLAGSLFLLLAGPRLLPRRAPAFTAQDDVRQYTAEMEVEPDSPLVGQTIEQAGLRHLPGAYLMEIDRQGQLLPAVSSQERLHAGDRLAFVGVVESVVDLRKVRGLRPATTQVGKVAGAERQRSLVEAVVSDSCPLVGRSIRQGRFRSVYNAAVIAVARNGQRVRGKIGDIVLRSGDTLLLETHPAFAAQQRNARDFYLVSALDGAVVPRHERAGLALGITGLMVLAAALGWLPILVAALAAACLMLLAGCCSATTARRHIDWQVLLVIVAAAGLGRGLEVSGAAGALAGSLLAAVGGHPWLALGMVYGVTVLFTEVITNNAAALLVLPLALDTAGRMGVSPLPFAVAVMMAASASFATPIGYQTNLMVMGPGGYRFTDYLRIGVPMGLLVGAVTVGLVPLIWGF